MVSKNKKRYDLLYEASNRNDAMAFMNILTMPDSELDNVAFEPLPEQPTVINFAFEDGAITVTVKDNPDA